MDLLRKNFWIVNLLAFGLSAALAGRAASHWAEDLITGGQAVASPPRRTAPPAVDQARSKEITNIVRRNIFCSSCTPATPSDDSAQEGPSSNEPQRTTLQLELVSTMVVPADERWSMAVIRDLSTKERDPMLYARGSQLPGGAGVVLRVIERKVYFQVGNHIEYLELDSASPSQAPAAATHVASASAGGEGLGDIGNRIRCSGATCDIDRALVEQALSNTAALATTARFVPSVRDGKPNGFKLYAIRPGSLFDRLGLKNADTVKAINGMEMSSPDQALSVYSKLRSASHLTVTVERRGETQTLDYTIR